MRELSLGQANDSIKMDMCSKRKRLFVCIYICFAVWHFLCGNFFLSICCGCCCCWYSCFGTCASWFCIKYLFRCWKLFSLNDITWWHILRSRPISLWLYAFNFFSGIAAHNSRMIQKLLEIWKHIACMWLGASEISFFAVLHFREFSAEFAVNY